MTFYESFTGKQNILHEAYALHAHYKISVHHFNSLTVSKQTYISWPLAIIHQI
jgi:hypothetical protein